jgi:eukaryotic-like serine/threonine-protein kinase
MIGESVGSYRLVEKLGEGGMGEVYLAEHRHMARRAAVKLLLRELSAAPDVVGRFFAEARAASVIEHPGIVQVLDCDVHRDGRAYIVMELLRGEDLRGYITRVGALAQDEAAALAILRRIAEALAAAHAQGIVHRDLKPDNVFLHLPNGRSPYDPVVKLLDFGIAKLIGRSEGTKTRTGQLLGTPIYMSPEQCRGAGKVDSLSDVYSFGCIMYEMLCGRPPFIEDGFGDLIISHVSRPPPDPLCFAPAMMPVTRQIVLDCLAKDPSTRPQSMTEIAESLTAAGATDPIDLKEPVALRTMAEGHAPSGGVRSPAGLSPRMAATTPMAAAPATPLPVVAMPVSVGGTRLLSPAPTTLAASAAPIEEPGLRPPRAGRGIALAIGVLALAAGGVIFWVGTSSGRPATRATISAGASSGEPAATAQPPPPANVTIDLAGLPIAARVRLDGRATDVPFTIPRGFESHAVIVEAEGYAPLTLSVDGRTDRTLTVEMTKVAPPAVKEPPKPEPTSHRRSEHRHGSPGFKGFTDL